MTEKDQQQQQAAIQFWLKSAQHDHDTAQSMYTHQHYDWSLFVFQLATEKLLKALVIAAEKTPPYTHDLERLAVLAELPVTSEQKDQLVEITKFNIEARYAKEKMSLYERATPEYTATWQKHCENIFIWLEQILSQKTGR